MADRPAHRGEDAPGLRRALTRFQSVVELVDHWAGRQPQRTALVGPRARQGWSRLSWHALHHETCLLAARLLRHGLRPGEHVGILAEGDAYVDCLVAYLAILRCGAVMVPLNPRHADPELLHAIDFSDCAVILVQDRLRERLESFGARPGRVRSLLDLSAGASPANAGHPAGDAGPFPSRRADDLANIVFTSGTTATPKAVMHTHATALATGAIFSAALGLRNSDVFHHAIPFFTSSGTQFAFMPAVWVGATLVVEPRFDAGAMLQRIEDEGTTAVIGVPSHYLFLLDELERRPRALGSMRLWDYGGASMPPTAVRALARLHPHIEQRKQYGLTETGPSGTLLTPDMALARIESAGRPMPLCEVRIVDGQGRTVQGRTVGQVAIRSPACMAGYYKNPDETRAVLVDGWVMTGDLGWLDEDGYLYYSDRLKDIVNRGGLKISSIEIEEVLYAHPDVLEAAVVAMPHDKLGEDVMAFVTLRQDARFDADALRRFCLERLADYKAPRHFTRLDAFPRNAMGKIQKAALRASLASAAG